MTEQNRARDGQAQLLEEARLLFDVVAERALPWLQRLSAEPTDSEHSPSTCGWCPLCAMVAVAKGERPELAARTAEHLAGLVMALRTALQERTGASSTKDEPQPPAESAEPAPPSPPVSRVQRITVEREC